MVRKIVFGLLFATLASFAAAQDPVTERPGQPAAATPPAPATSALPATPRASDTPPAATPPAATRSAATALAIPGSCWAGTEAFNGNGALHFGLRRDGTAVMIDARSTVPGR
jgi:hypothetical protein